MTIWNSINELKFFKSQAKASQRAHIDDVIRLYESRVIDKAITAVNIVKKFASSSPKSQEKALKLLDEQRGMKPRTDRLSVPAKPLTEESLKIREKREATKKVKDEIKIGEIKLELQKQKVAKQSLQKEKVFFVRGNITYSTTYERTSQNRKTKEFDTHYYTTTQTAMNQKNTIRAISRDIAMTKFKQDNSEALEENQFYKKTRTVDRIDITQCIEAPSSGTSSSNMMMKKAKPFFYNFINDDRSKLSEVDGFCVPDQFVSTYGPDENQPDKKCIKTLTIDRFINLCYEVRGETRCDDFIECPDKYSHYGLDFGLDIDVGDEPTTSLVISSKKWCISDGVSAEMLCKICEKLGISHYALDITRKCFLKYVSPSRNYPALFYYAVDNHMYHITNKDACKSLLEKSKDIETKLSSTALKEQAFLTEKENIYETQTIFQNVEIKDLINCKSCIIIYTETNDLSEILDQIILQYNYIPTFSLKKCFITQINFNFENKNITLVIDPNDKDVCSYKIVQEFCKIFNTEFKNQSFSQLINDLKKRFFDNSCKRHKFTQVERNEMWKKEKKCKNCSKSVGLKNFHLDHIVALANGGTNDLSNIQMLCVGCHQDKTRAEKENGYVKMVETESSFNSTTKEIFQSDLSFAYAFIEQIVDDKDCAKMLKTMNASKLFHLDINKCRKNILYYQKHCYPVFTVMDKPEIYNGDTVAGLYYVETQQHFPMRGNGWYYLPMVEYCLSNDLIKSTDVKYVIKASLSVDANYYNKFIDYVYGNLENDFAKLAVNGMIGCFKPKVRENWKSLGMTSSANEAYNLFLAHNSNFIDVRTIDDKDYYNVYNKYLTQKEESEAPIYHQIVELEAIELHKLAQLVKNNNGFVLDLNTDCVSCVFKNDEFPFQMEDVSNIQGYYYDDAKTLPKYKIENKTARLNVKKLIDEAEYKDKLYYERLQIQKLAKMNRIIKYEHKEMEWLNFNDVEDNNFEPLVKMIIESKKSIHIDGRAGVGKSSLIKNLQTELTKMNIKFTSLAPTNKACRIINGKTIHKFIGCHSRTSLVSMDCNVIFIDEISMVPEKFYKFFIILKTLRPDIIFIISGDFEQLLPVNDRVGECDYKASPALHELCDGRRLCLTKCRRANSDLFNLCDPQNISKIQKSQFGSAFASRHICFTNKKRMEVNEKMMNTFIKNFHDVQRAKKQKLGVVLEIEKSSCDANSQNLKLMKGMPIIAKKTCDSDDYSFANNETFKIENVNSETITIMNDDAETQEIPTLEFVNLFYIAFCITTHKSQGESYDFPYTIHQWSQFSDRMKYVALTRSTDIKFINIL